MTSEEYMNKTINRGQTEKDDSAFVVSVTCNKTNDDSGYTDLVTDRVIPMRYL